MERLLLVHHERSSQSKDIGRVHHSIASRAVLFTVVPQVRVIAIPFLSTSGVQQRCYLTTVAVEAADLFNRI